MNGNGDYMGVLSGESITYDKLIDMHCHILPGLDDGAVTMEETVKALAAAKRQGISVLICTPHFNPDQKNASPEQIRQMLEKTKKRSDEAGLDLEFYPGQELMYHSDLPRFLEQGEVLTLADSRYVLVEFVEDVSYREIIKGILRLMDYGYLPILAHYERYRCLMDKKRKQELKQEKIFLQMNYDTVQRTYGIFHKNPFRTDLEQGIVDFMGSDCHGSHFRPYRIGPSLRWMEQALTEEMKQKIFVDNPGKILGH